MLVKCLKPMVHPVKQQFGPYTTLKMLGSSEHSAVYTAIHETTGRIVALRATTITVKDVDSALQQCKDVLQDVQELDIPNTVKIEDFGNDGATLYMAMTAMDGGTLLERMKIRMLQADQPTLPSLADVLMMTERLATALDNLHQLEMVHGQIQPHSILFNDRGQAFLSEIGITRILKIIFNLDASNSFNMTRYSPPELWQGERPSPATDQYALACIIYQLLTGKVPFDGKSIFTLMQAHANDIAPPPNHIRDNLPEDLALVFWRALAKPIERRYPSTRAFYQDLQKALTGYPMQTTDFFKFMVH